MLLEVFARRKMITAVGLVVADTDTGADGCSVIPDVAGETMRFPAVGASGQGGQWWTKSKRKIREL